MKKIKLTILAATMLFFFALIAVGCAQTGSDSMMNTSNMDSGMSSDTMDNNMDKDMDTMGTEKMEESMDTMDTEKMDKNMDTMK